MESRQDGQVIYLKDLLFSALYKWKSILVWAVILAVLLGGVKGLISYTNMKNEEFQKENFAQQELELEVYETRKASLQQQIEANRVNARHQQKYLDESVLMNLDAYNHYEVYLSFFLETDYQIMPGMSYQNPDPTSAVIKAYMEGVTNDTNAKQLADSIGTESEYLLELLSTDTPYEAKGFSFHFRVPDKVSGEKLLECLKQVIEQLQAEISQIVALHEVHIKEAFIRQTIASWLAQQQQDQANKLTALNDVITDLQQQKNDLLPPESVVVSGGSVLKDALVFAVVGGILGVMLVVMIAWMQHIFGSTVYSRKALTNRTGIKVLGSVKAGKRRNAVDAWLRVVEGRNDLPADKQNAMLACSVAAAMGNEGVLQISGQCSAEERIAFAEALRQTNAKITVCDAGNILQDVSARPALNQADCVLLMEQCGVSTYEGVQDQIDVIVEHGKKILGCVLIDG